MFRREQDTRIRGIVGTLRETPLFRGFSRTVLNHLAEAVHVRDYRRDEFLYYERDPGLGLYIVHQGRVRLLVEDEDGGVHELRQVSQGEIFGRLSLLGDFRRMETAQAITDTRVIGLFRPDLHSILKRHPATGAALLERLVHHLATTQTELLRFVARREGKVAARRLLNDISLRVDGKGADHAAGSDDA